jgi:hypothetical protein
MCAGTTQRNETAGNIEPEARTKFVRASVQLSFLSGPPTNAPSSTNALGWLLLNTFQLPDCANVSAALRWCGRRGGLLPNPTT